MDPKAPSTSETPERNTPPLSTSADVQSAEGSSIPSKAARRRGGKRKSARRAPRMASGYVPPADPSAREREARAALVENAEQEQAFNFPQDEAGDASAPREQAPQPSAPLPLPSATEVSQDLAAVGRCLQLAISVPRKRREPKWVPDFARIEQVAERIGNERVASRLCRYLPGACVALLVLGSAADILSPLLEWKLSDTRDPARTVEGELVQVRA